MNKRRGKSAARRVGTPTRHSSAGGAGGGAAPPTVLCFGEVLWDCLPRGLFLGGAPINAAYHLSQQGLRVVPVTAVGRDFLGDEVRRRVGAWDVDDRFITQDQTKPTGTVRAVLDAKGAARYEIARDVAWDRIAVPAALQRLKPAPAAIVYGTLALRSASNRHALTVLLDLWPEAWRVVDLNLRPPFDTPSAIAFALAPAPLVKLNDEELGRLTGTRPRSPMALSRAARQFADQHQLRRVCVTAGSRGAGLWWEDRWWWEDARPVQVRDTVGAGDAFLGGLLGALLGRNATPPEALASAARVGEFVAGADGATPAYRLDVRNRPVPE